MEQKTVKLNGVEITFEYDEQIDMDNGIYSPTCFEPEAVANAYIANVAVFLVNDLKISDRFFFSMKNIRSFTNRLCIGYKFTEIRNIKHVKFTWYVGYSIEIGIKPLSCSIDPKPNENTENSIRLFKAYHDAIKKHPHFKMLDKLWEEKTGHKLNWFKYPTSSLTGCIIWKNGKWVWANSSWYRRWIDGWRSNKRKFAA